MGKNTAAGVVAVAFALMGCGSDGEDERATLSDDEAQIVADAIETIQGECLSADEQLGVQGTSGVVVGNATAVLIDVYRANPEAIYAAPGSTAEEPLSDTMERTEEELRGCDPIASGDIRRARAEVAVATDD